MTGLGESYKLSDYSPVNKRLSWQRVLSSAYSGIFLKWKNEDTARAELYHYKVNDFELTRFDGSAAEYSRVHEHVQNDASDSYCFMAIIHGNLVISNQSRNRECPAGHFYIIDHGQPANLHNDANVIGLSLRVPKSTLKANLPDVNNICGKLFSADTGSGRIALDYFGSIGKHASGMSEDEFVFSCQQLTDLFSLTLDGMKDLQCAETTVQNILLSRIKQYVRAEITNPDLSTTLIAQKFGVTSRYIQMLFNKISITGQDYIRDCRLVYSRNLLQSPLQRSRSITEIAFASGFSSSAHFSTAFKKKYGLSPSATRS